MDLQEDQLNLRCPMPRGVPHEPETPGSPGLWPGLGGRQVLTGYLLMKTRGSVGLGSVVIYLRTSSQNPLSLRNRHRIGRIRVMTCWSWGWVLGVSLPPPMSTGLARAPRVARSYCR